MDINLDDIYVRFTSDKSYIINDERVKFKIGNKNFYHISDSPFIDFINGDEFKYTSHMRDTLQENHTPETFKELILNFNIDKLNNFKILIEEHDNFYEILDGHHRISIIYHILNIKKLDKKYFKFVKSNS